MISSRPIRPLGRKVANTLVTVQWLFVRIHCLLAGCNQRTRIAEKRVVMALTNDAVHRPRRGAV